MALPYAVINDNTASLSAGIDAFLLRPTIDDTDFQGDLVDVSSSLGGRDGAITSVSRDFAQLRSQRMAYEKFVKKVLAKVVESIIYFVDLQSNVDMDSYGPISGYLEVPEGFMSPDLTITGTLAQVNHVLKKVYYFAPNNTNGDVSLLIEVRDTPHFDCVSVPRPLRISRPLYTVYNVGESDDINETATLRSSCASVSLTNGHVIGYANRTIPIHVLHLNQAPEVHLDAGNSFTTHVDFVLSGLGFSVSDVDNDDVSGYTSFGQKHSAPISVTVSAIHGKISLPDRDHLSLYVGRGILDSHISFRGSMDAVNNALAQLQYVCRVMEGCGSHYTDRLTISVNDDGFFGRGGPMSDTKSVSISFGEV